MNSKSKRALLLLNLGTPDSADASAVGRYLKEFLMDPYVVDIPWLLRWILVHVLIVPKRQHASSELYQSIWTERGSPLLFHLQDLRKRVLEEFKDQEIHVEIAMRYGQPSIASQLAKLDAQGFEHVTVFPLYPQYAESSTLSSQREVERVAAELSFSKVEFISPFYQEPSFIESFAELVRAAIERDHPEHVLMSFHGLPERHVKRTDRSENQNHCLNPMESCCDKITSANRDCYRAQCFQTARLLAQASGLNPKRYSVSFQSRLGRTVWIRPYTDEVIPQLAKSGVQRLAVVCPSFVADCLETLEENNIRGAKAFRDAGGKSFTAIACPNSSRTWARSVIQIAGLGAK